MEKIHVSGLVLEIGSGNNPNPRSDILCDKYLEDNSQRAGGYSVRIDRPMIVADGVTLPFRDKSFDFVICSHILEHISDPKKFIYEITRVAKAGYIEVPSMLSEQIFGWEFHLWHIDLINNQLVFYPKTSGVQFGGFFHNLIKTSFRFRKFFDDNSNQMYVKIYWKNSVSFKISSKQIQNNHKNKILQKMHYLFDSIQLNYPIEISYYIYWLLQRIFHKVSNIVIYFRWIVRRKFKEKNIISLLQQILICPTCKTLLIYRQLYFTCNYCKKKYSVSNFVISMSDKNK